VNVGSRTCELRTIFHLDVRMASVYVCMYVCIYVCIYIHTHIHTYIYAYIVCIYACMAALQFVYRMVHVCMVATFASFMAAMLAVSIPVCTPRLRGRNEDEMAYYIRDIYIHVDAEARICVLYYLLKLFGYAWYACSDVHDCSNVLG
jgi:hypothetical protein